MALTPQQLAEARSWINSRGYGSNYGADGSLLPASPFNFDNGDFGNFVVQDGAQAGNTGGAAADVLGAAMAAGYSDPAALSQITGIPAADIQPYLDSFSPQARNHLSTQGAMNLGYITPDEYQNFNRENSVMGDAPDYGAVGYSGGYGGSLSLDPSWQSSFDTQGSGPGSGPNPYHAARKAGRGGGPGPSSNLGIGAPQVMPAAPQVPAAGGTSSASADPYFGYTPNPMMLSQFGNMVGQVTDNLKQNILPGISDEFQAAGGFGDSGWGNATGKAIGDSTRALGEAGTSMLYQDFQPAMQRGLTRYGMDQGYDINLGQLGQQQQNSLQSFYTANRGLDQSGMQIGAGLTQQGTQGILNQGQGVYNLGLTQQNNEWAPFNAYNSILQPYATGYPVQTSSGQYGGGAMGALGGAGAGYQFARAMTGGQPGYTSGSWGYAGPGYGSFGVTG